MSTVSTAACIIMSIRSNTESVCGSVVLYNPCYYDLPYCYVGLASEPQTHNHAHIHNSARGAARVATTSLDVLSMLARASHTPEHDPVSDARHSTVSERPQTQNAGKWRTGPHTILSQHVHEALLDLAGGRFEVFRREQRGVSTATLVAPRHGAGHGFSCGATATATAPVPPLPE